MDTQSDYLMRFDVKRFLALLIGNKLWVIGGIIFSGGMGVIYSYVAPKIWKSEAVLAVKESQSGGGGGALLSQLGGLGGVLGLNSGNLGLEKMEIMIKGQELSENVLRDNMEIFPRIYPDLWELKASQWKNKAKGRVPDLRKTAEKIRTIDLRVLSNAKKKMLFITMKTRDSAFAKELLDLYLKELNSTIMQRARHEAESNRAYLEEQMSITTDPALRVKVQELIAREIERAMLTSSTAFDIVAAPQYPLRRDSPKRKIVLLIFIGVGALLSAFTIGFIHRDQVVRF